MKNLYSPAERMEKSSITAALTSGDPRQVCAALVSIAFHEADWRLAQDFFLTYLADPDPDISGVAASCLGHLARIHRVLDREKVILALQMQNFNAAISSRISDALDDIQMFLDGETGT